MRGLNVAIHVFLIIKKNLFMFFNYSLNLNTKRAIFVPILKRVVFIIKMFVLIIKIKMMIVLIIKMFVLIIQMFVHYSNNVCPYSNNVCPYSNNVCQCHTYVFLVINIFVFFNIMFLSLSYKGVSLLYKCLSCS